MCKKRFFLYFQGQNFWKKLEQLVSNDQMLGFILNVMALLNYYLNLQQYFVHTYVCVGVECSPKAFSALASFSHSRGH